MEEEQKQLLLLSLSPPEPNVIVVHVDHRKGVVNGVSQQMGAATLPFFGVGGESDWKGSWQWWW